ncbi:MAG TPA: molybdopterin-dependent oxidoreductase, partial [Desulfomonilia bacterium]|nr:molybdopterin-dependent oxidoreductase [Desulfomonilia bacterium]
MRSKDRKIPKITFFAALLGLEKMLKFKSRRHPEIKHLMKQKNCCIQIKLKDNSQGRYFIFKDGDLSSKNGINPRPDASMVFYNAEAAVRLMKPNRDQLEQINAMKNFQVGLEGPDELTQWFTQLTSLMMTAGQEFGVDMGNGVMRYTNGTYAGPVFVYVKNGKILRITPIEFDESDADPWTITARGKDFTPPRKSALSPYGLNFKSQVYSPDRLLYPLKRIDFNPAGDRNCKNRGISGYERISWDEALDIVAGEIKRVKKEYGASAILTSTGSHHMFGNVGYFMSAQRRFMNLIGNTFVVQNADSWEGWYWGAMHHWGNSMRLGGADSWGLVEEALKHCEMMVFWSSDPESTAGAYGGMEGSIRRLWLKDLGVKFVHIDPFYNHTAALLGGKWLAPRPDCGNAMALAIAYVWIAEDLYDKEYVRNRTTGFDEWKDYVLGKEDGIPKTPEWQENETNVPARDVRALAREWASKKTFLAAGGGGNVLGGACRAATGIEWARSMVYLAAMQGLGKKGINMGNMQAGTPINATFFFPGYTEGGFSGDFNFTALAVNMFNRMP